MAKISVIIPTIKGREALLKRLLASIPDECEVIIMDDEKMLLAEKRNKGAAKATGDYFIFIDDDNYLKDGCLTHMFDFKHYIGVIGMTACYDHKKLLVSDGGSKRNYVSGFTLGMRTNAKTYEVDDRSYEVDEVANAFMIPRHVFEEVGGFDEDTFPIDLDEADICKRIKDMGYKIIMNPKAICYHRSQTYSFVPDFRRPLNAFMMARNRVLFQKKHLHWHKLIIYFVIFFPIFVVAYWACLLLRRKPKMMYHFTKGIIYGLRGCLKNKYQQR